MWDIWASARSENICISQSDPSGVPGGRILAITHGRYLTSLCQNVRVQPPSPSCLFSLCSKQNLADKQTDREKTKILRKEEDEYLTKAAKAWYCIEGGELCQIDRARSAASTREDIKKRRTDRRRVSLREEWLWLNGESEAGQMGREEEEDANDLDVLGCERALCAVLLRWLISFLSPQIALLTTLLRNLMIVENGAQVVCGTTLWY